MWQGENKYAEDRNISGTADFAQQKVEHKINKQHNNNAKYAQNG